MSEKSSGVTVGQGLEDDIVPNEIKLMADKRSIDLYLKLLESGSEKKRDIRLVVLGKKGAGKTSLIRRLFGEDITDVTSTNGIEIHKIKCKAMSDDGIWKWNKLDENYDDTQERLFKEYVGQLQDRSKIQEPVESHIAIKDHTPVTSFDESKKSETENQPVLKKPPEAAEPQSEPPVTPQQSNQSSEQAIRDFETMLSAKSTVDVNDKEEYATFLLWDFAGDEEFFHTHQTFLSQDAMYLVVIKLNEADNYNAQALFRLWIDTIHCYSRLEEENITSDKTTLGDNDPPVVIVGTWKDAVTSETDTIGIACRTNMLKYTNDLADDERGHVRCEYFISNKDDDHIVFQKIRQNILNLARGMRTWNIEYPLKFIQLEQRLQEKKKELPIISYHEIKAISTDTPMPLSEEELLLFLEFHHELRSLVYFKDLPDDIILDTQWLSDAFKCIVTAKKFQASTKNHRKWDEFYYTGKLNNEVLEDIFKKTTNMLHEHKDYILNVMEKFDIIIRPNKSEGANEIPYYYVPCMIKAEPEFDIHEMFNVTKNIGKRSTWMRFKFIFLPPHLKNHLIASLSRKYNIAEKVFTGQKQRQIALFKSIAVFELEKTTKLRKLLVMTLPNVIQIQVWEFGEEIKSGLYKYIADFVTEELNTIMHSKFKMSNVKFEKTWKCGLTEPECVTGTHKFMEEPITEYQCDTCQVKHNFIGEWSDYQMKMSGSILTKLRQLNKDEFSDLVALGTFASYENRVYFAGPCKTGKTSLASILIGDDIPKTWESTDGLVIHFGRNGIDLDSRKMVPLQKGSGDILTKMLLGKPYVTEQKKQAFPVQKTRNSYTKEDVPISEPTKIENKLTDPMQTDQLQTKLQQQKANATARHISSVERQQMESTSNPHPSKRDLKSLYTAGSIQQDMLDKIKKISYIMNTAPCDLVDFGGQKSFDMTHQLFIQHRGTFILMFDGSKGLDCVLTEYDQGKITAADILEHWINSVLTYCNISKDKMPRILFAATHSDFFSKEKKARLTELFEQKLTNMFSSHNLRDHIVYDKVFFIDARNPADQDIDSLKGKLVDIAVNQDTWGEKTPIIWIPLDLQISDMRAAGVNFITKDTILNLNRSNGKYKLTEKQVNNFLLVKHSIGQLLYIDEPALRDNIVIQPTAMVNILRAFITDITFWPEKGNERDILDNLSSTGVLKKTDLFILWSQPAFADILTDENTKNFVVKVLLHLDILVEPKRYTKKEGYVDWFLVPCVVKENIPPEMKNAATDNKTICLAYHLKKTVIPSALSFKLIGAAISIWPLKKMDKHFCLYFQAAVMDADNKNELQIHVEGQRILVYIIHKDSKQLISPDLAIATRECLTLALERILQFYHCSFGQQSHQEMSDLFEIEVGEICQGGTCLIPLSDAKQERHWKCKNGNKHETLYWCVDKNKQHCDPNCKGLDTKTLNLEPNDQHFVQLARTIDLGDFYEFFINLGMTKNDYDSINISYISNSMDFKLIGLFEWRKTAVCEIKPPTFGRLLSALRAIEKPHHLCQVLREDHTFTEIADTFLQQPPSDDVITKLTDQKLIGNCVVHLGIELGLSINNIMETMHNCRQNVSGQIHSILMKWKNCDEMNMVTPTIYRLILALKRVKAAEGLQFVMNMYNVEQKDIEEKCHSTLQDSTKEVVHHKVDFSDILDKMMAQLVISVDDRRSIEQNDDPETKLLNIMIKRGEPNKSVGIDVLKQNGGYQKDIEEKLSNSPSLVPPPTKTELQDVPDYKIRLQKNYLKIIKTLKHDQ